MKKIIITTFIILLFTLLGCKQIDDFRSGYDKEPVVQEEVNETEPEPEPKANGLVENKTNFIFVESDNQCIIIYDKKDITTMVDCGGEDFIYAIKEMKDLGLNKLDNFYFTNMQENLDLIVSKFKPDIILEKEYFVYDDVVIAGRCTDVCEKQIMAEEKSILVLANEGKCETNSLEFLIQINPDITISNNNICDDISYKLEILDVQTLYKNKDRIQIVFEDNGSYEVFK